MVADAVGDSGLAGAYSAAHGVQPIEGIGQTAAAGACMQPISRDTAARTRSGLWRKFGKRYDAHGNRRMASDQNCEPVAIGDRFIASTSALVS